MAEVDSQILGGLAQCAIAKYSKQAIRREAAVLAGKDPEELHQMRVGMRRLRTALQVFQPSIKIPKAAREPRVADVARKLGELRDLDVIRETLQQQFLPNLPAAEQGALEAVFETLADRHRQVFKQVKQLLEGDKYRQLKKGLKGWLKQPNLTAIAALPATTAMPDLLLPLVSRLWLHPGWLVGTTETLEIDAALDAEAVDALISDHDETLHSLRKQIKRVRYQLKLVEDLYGDALACELDHLEAMQETLGQIQDSLILADFLEGAMADARSHLPSLFTQLADNRHQAWQQWQSLQQTYLDPATRHQLRQILLTPQASGAVTSAKNPPAAETDSEPESPKFTAGAASSASRPKRPALQRPKKARKFSRTKVSSKKGRS
jgi:CHAD domain-containing protein